MAMENGPEYHYLFNKFGKAYKMKCTFCKRVVALYNDHE